MTRFFHVGQRVVYYGESLRREPKEFLATVDYVCRRSGLSPNPSLWLWFDGQSGNTPPFVALAESVRPVALVRIGDA